MGDEVNPRMEIRRFPLLLPDQYALRDRDLFATDDPAYADLRERLAAIRLGSFMSVGAPLPGGERLVLVLHRDLADSREFDADEEAFARALSPHLQQVFRIDQRLRATQSHAHELKQAIDIMRCGLVLCDADARVCWANEAAEHLRQRETLWPSAARLTTPCITDTNTLRRMIAEASLDQNGTGKSPVRVLVLRRDSAAEPMHLLLQPMAADGGGESASSLTRARVLLMLSSPGVAPALPASLIATLFALSPAESRLTAALCRGELVEDYARTAGVTVGTARFQLKQVLAKTQVRRQSELIRRIYSSVIAHALPRSH